MNILMEENGLSLTRLNSEATTDNNIELEQLEHKIFDMINKDSFVVAWLDHEVLIGKYKQSKFTFYDNERFEYKYLKQMRIFNKHEELFIWRMHDTYNARFRKDIIDENKDVNNDKNANTKKQYVVIARQVLFGTDFGKCNELKNNDDFTQIKEARGAKLILPFNKDSMNNLNSDYNRIFISTHNYLGNEKDKLNQGYVDCRFVTFCRLIQDQIVEY